MQVINIDDPLWDCQAEGLKVPKGVININHDRTKTPRTCVSTQEASLPVLTHVLRGFVLA